MVFECFVQDPSVKCTDGCVVFCLNELDAKALRKHSTRSLLRSYVSKDRLTALATKESKEIGQILEELYISTKPVVMASEFAETLVLEFLLGQHRNPKHYPLRKWRWKEDKDQPIQKTDVVILSSDPAVPDASDYVMSAEVKSKAVKNSKWSPISEAIKGAEVDAVGRIARTLAWARQRARKRLNESLTKRLDRFVKAPLAPPYSLKVHAIAVIDSELAGAEIAKPRVVPANAQMSIVVLALPALKLTYKRVFKMLCRKKTK